MHRWIATLLLAGVAAGAAAQVHLATVAPEPRFEFSLRTRWGQVLQGRFASGAGEVVDLGDGKRQVRLRLPTNRVEILGHPRLALRVGAVRPGGCPQGAESAMRSLAPWRPHTHPHDVQPMHGAKSMT